MTLDEYLALPEAEMIAMCRRAIQSEFFNDHERAVVLAVCDAVDKARRELAAALDTLRQFADSAHEACAVCGAVLEPKPYVTPHCEDCIVEDEHVQAYDDKCNDLAAKVDAVLGKAAS